MATSHQALVDMVQRITGAVPSTIAPNVKDANDVTTDQASETVLKAERKAREAQEKRLARELAQDEKLATVFDGEQCETLAEIGFALLDEAERRISWRITLGQGIVKLFPSPASLTWERYKLAQAWIRRDLGAHAATIFRECIARLAEEYKRDMPHAGRGTGKGIKGLTPKKASKGIASTTDALAERIAKLCRLRNHIAPAVLHEVTAALKVMRQAVDHLQKSVNE